MYLLKYRNLDSQERSHTRERGRERKNKETLNRSTIIKDFKPDFAAFKIHIPSELHKLFYRKQRKKGFPNSFMKPWFSGTKTGHKYKKRTWFRILLVNRNARVSNRMWLIRIHQSLNRFTKEEFIPGMHKMVKLYENSLESLMLITKTGNHR